MILSKLRFQRYFFIPMLFFTLLLYALNLRLALDIERFNPIEKSTWLMLSLLIILRGNYDKLTGLFILYFFVLVNILLVGVEHPIFSYQVLLFSFTQIPILLILCSAKFNKSELILILKFFICMPALICLIGFFYSLLGITEVFGVEYSTGISRLKGSTISAYLASWCIAAVYACLKVFDYTEEKKYLLIGFLNLYILYLTVARVPLFICLLIAAFVFYRANKIHGFIKFNATILGSAFAVLLILFFADNYFSRLDGSGSSGRDMIWEYLLAEYELNFKDWGAGFGHQYLIIPEDIINLTSTIAAHNEYIRIMLELGFTGSLFFWFGFIVFFIRLYILSKSSTKHEILLVMPLFMFFSYFDNTISSPAVFSFIFLCFIVNNSDGTLFNCRT